MKFDDISMKRRSVLRAGGAALGLAALPGTLFAADKPKIGIIGAGRIGGVLGKLWADAGYSVMLSARDLGPVKDLAAQIGHGVQVGTPKEAAAFGNVVVVSVPWGALAQIGSDYGVQLKSKVVLDTCNPNVKRDGPGAQAGLDKGAGIADQEMLPGTHLVRAFNSIMAAALASDAHRAGEPIGIELAGDAVGLAAARDLVRDAGFEPVVVGDLARGKLFDPGTPVYPKAMTAKEIRAALNLE